VYRPMLGVLVLFMVGIIIETEVPILGFGEPGFVLLLVLLVISTLLSFGHGRIARASSVAGVVAAGCLLTAVYQGSIEVALPAGSPVTLVGHVESLPRVTDRGFSFILNVSGIREVSEGVRHGGLRAGTDVYITVSRTAWPEPPGVGDGLCLRVQLCRIREPGQGLPKGFDGYLYSRGIAFTGRVQYACQVRHSPSDGGPVDIQRFANRWRQMVQYRLRRALTPASAGLLSAVILGDKEGLNKEQRQGLADAGLLHFFTVSGLHVGIVAGMICLLLKLLPVPGGVTTAVVVMVVAVYVVLTGARASGIRAGAGLALGLLASVLKRQSDPVNLFAFVATLMLCLQPLLLYNTGWQMSFLATFGILLLFPRLVRWLRDRCGQAMPQVPILRLLAEYAIASVAVSIAAQLGVAPLLALHFNRLSLLGMAAGIVINPVLFAVFGATTIYLLLGGIPVLGPVLGWIMEIVSQLLGVLVELVTAMPYAGVGVSVPSFAVWGMFYGGLVFVLLLLDRSVAPGVVLRRLVWRRLRHTRPERAVLTSLFLILALSTYLLVQEIPSPLASVTFLNVGHGDSICIQWPGGGIVMLDGGGLPQDPGFVGERILSPWLKRQGISHLDYVIVSHPHYDHLEGVVWALDNLSVGCVLDNGMKAGDPLYTEYLQQIERKGIPHHHLRRGSRLVLTEKRYLEVIYPDVIRAGMGLNNNSLVCRFVYDNVSMLFTGDVNAQAKRLMIEKGWVERSAVLKLAHHGSWESFSPVFLGLVKPEVAVLPAGSVDRAAGRDVAARLRAGGVKVYRTDVDGHIRIVTDGCRIWVETAGDT